MTTITLRTLRSSHGGIRALNHVQLPPRCQGLPFHLLSQRHQSSQSTSTSVSARTNTQITEAPRSLVNPPLSSLPPPIDVPIPPPNTSPFKPGHLFQVGKAYVTFYKTAIVNIWRNRKGVIDIRLDLPDKFKNGSMQLAAEDSAISRADYQFFIRSRRDMRRVPLFVLLVAICGEFTPLIVMAVGGMVPPTAWIPKQVQSYREKLEERRKLYFETLQGNVQGKTRAEQLSRSQLLFLNASCRLSSPLWERLLPGRMPGLPSSILKKRVNDWAKYIELDSKLLRQGGGAKELSEEEVTRALVERGVDVLQYNKHQRLDMLSAWLKSLEKEPVLTMLMKR